MLTILDFTKEIADEIRRYQDEFTLTFTPDTIRIVSYYIDEDWTVTKSITFSNGFFYVSIDDGDNIVNEKFKTIKKAIDFIFN